jgi:hypothetical protein
LDDDRSRTSSAPASQGFVELSLRSSAALRQVLFAAPKQGETAILISMNHKAVLFDMDGVIVNNEPLHTAAFQTALKRYGHTLSEDQYKQHFAGKTDKDGFKHYFNFIEQIQPPAI